LQTVLTVLTQTSTFCFGESAFTKSIRGGSVTLNRGYGRGFSVAMVSRISSNCYRFALRVP